MTDYNWKSCADPANAARLRELLEAGREVCVRRRTPNKIYFELWVFRALWLADLHQVHFNSRTSFIDPDEPAQMRARIAELEAENQRLTEIAEYNNEHLANYRKQLNDRDERKEIYD